MPITHSGNLKQTLICFPTIPSAKKASTEVESQNPPHPAIELPIEVWTLILQDLSTIALKGARLVCKEWSRLAAAWLFDTVYLDSWEDSWMRLQQLAQSPYACMTTKIVWTPLAIRKTCLDSAVWRQTYPNLTRGINHSRILQLHKTFCKVYHDSEEKVLVKRTARVNAKSLKLAMARFTGCGTITMEDDSDVEARCKDPALRRRIQHDDELLQKPSIWGTLSHWWTYETDFFNRDGLDSSVLVLDLINSSTHVRCLEFCLWNSNLDHALQRFYDPLKMSSAVVLTNICIKIKWCKISALYFVDTLLPANGLADSPPITIVFQRFPKVGQITIQSQFTNPDPVLLSLYHQGLREDEDFHDVSDDDDDDDDDSADDHNDTNSEADSSSSCSHCSTVSDVEVEHYPQLKLWRDMMFTLRAESFLDLWAQMPNLTSLKFHNITLNTRALIFWLCNQTQIPHQSITIKLTGMNILYGLAKSLFGKILRSINVRLEFDHEQTYYHETELTGMEELTTYEPFEVKVPNSWNRWRVTPNCGTQTSFENDYHEGNMDQIPRLAVGYCSGNTAPLDLRFVHRPDTITSLVSTWEKDSESRLLHHFYCAYYVCFDSGIYFKWACTAYHPHDSPPNQYVLFVGNASLDDEPEYGGYGEPSNYEEMLSAEENERLAREADFAIQQFIDRGSLHVYETEF